MLKNNTTVREFKPVDFYTSYVSVHKIKIPPFKTNVVSSRMQGYRILGSYPIEYKFIVMLVPLILKFSFKGCY